MLNLFCLVKDLHTRYTFYPDRDISYLTGHAKDVEEFFKKNMSSTFSSRYTDGFKETHQNL